jgi:hypothetical protein
MLGIDLHLGGACLVVDVEDFLEGGAAVGGAEEAAFCVGAIGVAGDGNEDGVGVAGVDGDLANLLAVSQTKVGPRLACVGGFVDAVAGGEVGAGEAFAAADVDEIGVGGGDGDGANWMAIRPETVMIAPEACSWCIET